MKFSETDITTGVDAKLIAYIEKMNAKDSSLNKIENLEERKKLAMKECSLQAIPETEEFKRLVVYYLSYFQHYNEYTLLRTREELLQEVMASMGESLVATKDEDKKLKNVKLKGDLDQLAERLVEGCEKLRKKIYGELEDVASEVIKVSISPEQRLKQKK